MKWSDVFPGFPKGNVFHVVKTDEIFYDESYVIKYHILILFTFLYLCRMFSVSDWFLLAIFCWVARKWKMLINPWMNLGEPSGWSLDDKSLGTLSYQLDWFLLRLLILGNAWRERPRQFNCNRFEKNNVSKIQPKMRIS